MAEPLLKAIKRNIPNQVESTVSKNFVCDEMKVCLCFL